MNKIGEETLNEEPPVINQTIYLDVTGTMTDEDYYMMSDIFVYDDLKKIDDFGIKRYKNALFKG